MDRIQDIFDEIINEAAVGNIDCGFLIPICFGTKELDNNGYKEITVAKEFDNSLIPTLLIKDRNRLINRINDYVEHAKEFYSKDIRLNDVLCREKYIIASLLSNALVTDFNDIDRLFERGTNFIKEDVMSLFDEGKNIGYSSVLKSNIIVRRNKQSIVQEVPYGLDIHLEDDNGNVLYKFPTVRYGISDDKAYIYSIQGLSNITNDKKIERTLRKVGEGFDEKNAERDPIENPENLYSINPWSLVALSIAIPLIKNNSNVKEFLAPYFLVNRWNAIKVSYNILKEKYKDNPSIINKKEEQILHHDEVQRNITDKFLRTFRRMEHHFSNINISSFELENDSCLHLQVSDQYNCNNTLLNEVYSLANNYTSKTKNI